MMPSREKFNLAWAVCIAALFVLPIIVIGWISTENAALLQPILPKRHILTNMEALQQMLRSISVGKLDSWDPMLNAISVVHSERDHARLYETVFFGQNVKFQYPPTSLLPIDLLARFGLASGTFLNSLNFFIFVANAAALGWIAALLFSPKNDQGGPSTRDRWAQIGIGGLAFTAAFFFYPLVNAKLLGQIQLWVDLLFTLTILSWLLKQRTLAGMLIGLACIIKPQAAILLVWALAWKEWKLASGIVITAVPISIASVLGYGFHNHVAYLKVLSFLSAHGETYFANNSMNGLLNRLLGNGENLRFMDYSFPPFHPVVYAGTMIFAVAALIAMLAPAWLSRRPINALDLAAATILSVIMSPIAWEHHYGVMAPLYLVALRAWLDGRGESGNWYALGALALSWTLTATFIPLPNLLADSPFNILQSYMFVGALIFLGVAFWWSVKRPIHAIPSFNGRHL